MENKFKLLIVEDEPDICKAAQSYFAKRGFLVSTTSSGLQALKMINEIKPNLVLLDVSLNDLNGIEMLKRLRKYDNETNVVFITGQLFPDDKRSELIDLGINGFINKPIILDKLNKLVHEVINNGKKSKVEDSFEKHGVDAINGKRDTVHELSNLLGIIRNKCESFVADIDEGFNKDKSDKEIVLMAAEVMNTLINTVDKATNIIDNLPKYFSEK